MSEGQKNGIIFPKSHSQQLAKPRFETSLALEPPSAATLAWPLGGTVCPSWSTLTSHSHSTSRGPLGRKNKKAHLMATGPVGCWEPNSLTVQDSRPCRPQVKNWKCLSLSRVRLFITRGLPPARLLHPWDSSGMNTGVSRPSLFQDLPDPGIEPRSPELQADSLLSEPPEMSTPRAG